MNLMFSLCTPAHAVSSTGTARAVRATAKPARLQKSILNSAAVDQDMVRRVIITAAARTGQTNNFVLISFFKNKGVRSDGLSDRSS